MNLQNSTYTKNGIQGFNVEATFKGQKALTFMKNMGYEFKPVLYKYHYDVTTTYYPDAMINPVILVDDNSKIDKRIISYYYPDNWVLKNTLIHGYYGQKYRRDYISYGFVYSIREQLWEKRENIYDEHAFGKRAGKLFKTIDEILPWQSWLEEYWKKRYK